MTTTMRISLAEAADEKMTAILGLIRQASGWLADMGTDQWQEPWPDKEGRGARIRRGLEVGATWIVWAGQRAVATVTVARKPNMDVWKDASCNFRDPAVYAHRLIIDRQFAGFGLGAELIDWTGLRGQREWGAKWTRIDVWSTNIGLHEYYMNKGFEKCGLAPDPEYPSGRLFQKPVLKISEPAIPLFPESELDALLLDCGEPRRQLFDLGGQASWLSGGRPVGRERRRSSHRGLALRLVPVGPRRGTVRVNVVEDAMHVAMAFLSHPVGAHLIRDGAIAVVQRCAGGDADSPVLTATG